MFKQDALHDDPIFHEVEDDKPHPATQTSIQHNDPVEVPQAPPPNAPLPPNAGNAPPVEQHNVPKTTLHSLCTQWLRT
uniref:Uncharacterized protein n=1 Tax=Psilocybe cubensis TaxID=181762 RepID=A0A8H7XNF5_PSICU